MGGSPDPVSVTPAPAVTQATPGGARRSSSAWRRFRRSTPGVVSAGILLVLYAVAAIAPFLAPYSLVEQHPDLTYQPPQRVRAIRDGRLVRPHVYPMTRKRDPVTFVLSFTE